MGHSTLSRSDGAFGAFEGAARFGAVFTTARQIADALWLAVFERRHAPVAPTPHVQPLLRLRPGDRPVGLVAVYVGTATPLEPTAILSIDTARAVAALIADDETWDHFLQRHSPDLATALTDAADLAAAEAANPRLPHGDLPDV